ncbi:MAG: low-specificity L-threonine aldolase [Myxococcales bacterium]|nr:low-specificity L-threonine aldolase [Myxococcales bacterium]
MSRPIDLRSDTLTRPTAAMREAMAGAEVGDDVYGDDPSVNALEERSAELLGKKAALFVPSGTMANQIALLLHCGRGDEVLVGEGAHCMFYESGAGPAWAGVSFGVVGTGGLFDAEQLRAALKPENIHFPQSRLVAVENTHNRAGGRVFPQSDVEAIAALARERGLALHLDGARIWNAAVATGRSPAQLAAPFDSVSACFSKGLGAPVGSVLAGGREGIAKARRLRKMLGGGMRQAGILAAAALYALDHHRERLREDHDNARLLAERLSEVAGVGCEPDRVETNIVNFTLEPGARMDAEELVARVRAKGVLINATGVRALRAVTHLDVDGDDIERGARVLGEVLGE